jgi:hypothetical protein
VHADLVHEHGERAARRMFSATRTKRPVSLSNHPLHVVLGVAGLDEPAALLGQLVPRTDDLDLRCLLADLASELLPDRLYG